MNKEFLHFYETELALLYEKAKEFAEDNPGIADRLGGLTQNNFDPAVAGLLEGSAFLSARIQQQIHGEFETFTRELLEQLLPNYLAPTPSTIMVAATPEYSDGNLVEGTHFPAGSYMDARFSDGDKRITCRYRTASDVTLWPLKLSGAEYLQGAAAFDAMGHEISSTGEGGIAIHLFRPSTSDPNKASGPLSDLPLSSLDFYLSGATAQKHKLYAQLLCDVVNVSILYDDKNGDPISYQLPKGSLSHLGFEEESALFPEDTQVFTGLSILREFFILPDKFLGFRINHLDQILPHITASKFSILIEFDSINTDLANRFDASHLRLFATPAVNLFEESCSSIKLDAKRHAYVVNADSSPKSNYETYRILDVKGQYARSQTKVPVYPMFGLRHGNIAAKDALYFTQSKRPLRVQGVEKKFGKNVSYLGTETLVSIYEPSTMDDDERLQRLRIKLLCSNRHLPELLPIGQGEVDFFLLDDVKVDLKAFSGRTEPKESLVDRDINSSHRSKHGNVLWRLISYLNFNFLGLHDHRAPEPTAALREILSIFADFSSTVNDRQLRGIIGIASEAVTRSINRDGAFFPARGIKITLTFDERAFEGTGVMLLAAVLDRFFAEYASFNSFTQTVVETRQSGTLKTFAPRIGSGIAL